MDRYKPFTTLATFRVAAYKPHEARCAELNQEGRPSFRMVTSQERTFSVPSHHSSFMKNEPG
jgi:hypothetical protein